ncbi:MAG: response regulator [Theionarchaea archaeon]|nr:response regulator [Theionarchaea archaeon]
MAKHILVVEDERIVAEDIRRSLQNLGYLIAAVVSSGEEALKSVAETSPDLVLMDIVLKGEMDGIQAAEHIRSQFSTPVVYLTAYADENLLQRAKITEPYGYILKPFEDKELYSVIEMALYKHKMEKKVRESEQWLFTTLKSIGDGIIATDTQSQITFMNPVAEALTGWTQKEALGKPLEDVFYIINEETRERCENPFEKIIETGGVVGLANNTVLIARDGTERLLADSGAPICDDSCNILGTVLVFRDITEKRKMEEDILRLKTEKMESINILAGGIAHDFNNILTAILGNISMATMHSSEGEVLKMLKEGEKACLRAKNLTQQLLMFSKEGISIKKSVSISELLQNTAEFTLRGSNVKCEFCMPDKLHPVEIDTGQISQVINNLIINAEQAMPKGGTIKVSAENVTVCREDELPLQEGGYVQICVEDQGIGIPEEYLERIFDPYFTTKQRGSGLGLATAHSIIENHGGYITVASKLGAGTTFYMWLPASEKEPVAEKEPGKVVKGKGRILVMDDDEDILKITGEVLHHLGYETAFAGNGSEAIEQYKKALETGASFDAVILDLTVQGGWGAEETIGGLLKIDPQVKAIVSSGYSNAPIMTEYKEYGFCNIVTKPYSIEELSRTLYEVVER